MLGEAKIFFENLTHFRQLLNEAVGQGTIADAINKHKIVHIYYAGDNTIMKGYRTVYPLVLGHTVNKDAIKRGEDYMLLRAWELAGNSDSKKMYFNAKGKSQYGWRLFRADKITSFLPTGEHFSTDVEKFPDGYNPNDKQMKGIVAAVKIDNGEPETQLAGDTIAQKLPEPTQPSTFAGQKDKFQKFSNVAKKQREITADEVKHLWGMVKQMRAHGSQRKYWVVYDEHGDMVLKPENQLKTIDPNAIVGNLYDLYIKLVKPNEKVSNAFLDKAKNDALKEANKMNHPNITQENTIKKTFFK